MATSNPSLSLKGAGVPALRAGVTLTLLLIFALIGFGWSNHSGERHFYGEPGLPNLDGATLNWSGYAVYGGDGEFDNVKGSWMQPAAKCSDTKRQLSVHWVGIDGYGSETVQQIGTGVQCLKGKPVYYAWYEFFPAAAKIIDTLEVRPGDEFSAEIQAVGQRFTLILTNTTTGKTFKTSRVIAEARKSSAEWITEGGRDGDQELPLTNFGSMRFYGAVATADGQTRGIDYEGWEKQQIAMVNQAGQVRADASGLSSNGKSFKVTWARH